MKISTSILNEKDKEEIVKHYFSTNYYHWLDRTFETLLPELFSDDEDVFIENVNNASFDYLYPIYVKVIGVLPEKSCHLWNESGEKITKPIFESIQPCSAQYELYLTKTFWGDSAIMDSNGFVLTSFFNDQLFNTEEAIDEMGGDYAAHSFQIGENEHGFLIKEDELYHHEKYGFEEQKYDIRQFNPTVSAPGNENPISSFQVTSVLKDMTDFTLNDATFPDVLFNEMGIELINKIRKNPSLFKEQVIAILTRQNQEFEQGFVRTGHYQLEAKSYLDKNHLFCFDSRIIFLDNLSIYPYLPFTLKVDLDVLLALFIRCMHTSELANKGIVPPANLQELKDRINEADVQLYESRPYFPIQLDETFIDEEGLGRNPSGILPFINNNLDRIRALFFLFPEIIFFAPDSLKENREIVMEAVRQNGRVLRHLPDYFKDDTDIVLTAVKNNPVAMSYASDRCKSDRAIALAAVALSGIAFEYISDELKKDKEIVRMAVQAKGVFLEQLQDVFRDDKKLVLAAVANSWSSLQFASDRLKNDRQVVLTALKQNGRALEYVSDSFKADCKIVLTAVKQNGKALQYASDSVKDDRKVVLTAVKQNGDALEFASSALKEDRQIALAAIKNTGDAFYHVSSKLKYDKQLALAAIKNDWRSFEYFPGELKNNREVIKAYCKVGRLSTYGTLKNNPLAVLLFVKKNGWNLELASDALKNDKKIVLEAVKQSGTALCFASADLKNNYQVVLAAVKQNGMALQYASEALKNNKKIVLAAIQQTDEPLAFASERLKKDWEIMNAVLILPEKSNADDLDGTSWSDIDILF